MPIYGYECEECSHHFEVLQSMSAAGSPPPPCEACGSPNTHRKLGTASAVFGSEASRRMVGGGGSCSSCNSSPSSCSGCGHKH